MKLSLLKFITLVAASSLTATAVMAQDEEQPTRPERPERGGVERERPERGDGERERPARGDGERERPERGDGERERPERGDGERERPEIGDGEGEEGEENNRRRRPRRIRSDETGTSDNVEGETEEVEEDDKVSGRYSGTLTDTSAEESDDFDGLAAFRVNSRMRFSGTMTTLSNRLRARGSFDEDGNYTKDFTLRDDTAVSYNFSLVATDTGQKIVGTVNVGETEYQLDTEQSIFNRANPAEAAGGYTLVITGDDKSEIDMGDGWATIRVNKNGGVRLSGQLGDLSKFAAKTSLQQDGDIVIVRPLYRKTGSIGGRLQFQDVTDVSDLNGVLNWTRPAEFAFPRRSPNYQEGFDIERLAVGSSYTRPSRGETALDVADVEEGETNLSIELSDSSGVDPITVNGVLNTRNRIVIDKELGTRAKLNARSGRINGLYKDSSGETTVRKRFSGVILQKQNNGSGLVTGETVTGNLFIEATAAPDEPVVEEPVVE